MKFYTLLLFAIITAVTAIAQPPPKHWEAIAYNNSSNEFAVFAGSELQNKQWSYPDSLWLFKENWKLIDGNLRHGRWAHTLLYHQNKLYSYGGYTIGTNNSDSLLSDLLEFDGKDWKVAAHGPSLHLPQLYSSGRKLLLVGQSSSDPKRFEVWQLQKDSFTIVSSHTLSSEVNGFKICRASNGFVVVHSNDSSVVFEPLGTGQNRMIVREPGPISKFAVTYVDEKRSYYLFGGLDAQRNFVKRFWKITNGVATELTSPESPSPRASHFMVPARKGFLLYGGALEAGKLSNELWRYGNEKWTRL
jgi:hypothetical protein